MMSRSKRNGSKKQDAASTTSGDNAASPKNQEEALQFKNYRLAKELSEVRVRQREESKNVSRLTMENMNLASRCREAIAQAASLKKELLAQKRKTGEAVSQTHQLLSELKKMKNSPDRKTSRRHNNDSETPSVTTEATVTTTRTDEASKSPESVSTKSTIPSSTPEVELDYQSDLSEQKNHDTTTPNGLVSSDDYESPAEPSPKPDAPASFEDDSEEQDTVPDTIPNKPPSFPSSESPKVPRRYPGATESGSYDEEYPCDLGLQQQNTSTKRSLLSSIDAFEASFKTSFPKSFTPTEGEESKIAYDPFDTNSPQKRSSDPPGEAPDSPCRSLRDKEGKRLSKLVGENSTDPRKQLLSRKARDPATQNAGERLADKFQKSIDASQKRVLKSEEPVVGGTESMVARIKKSLDPRSDPIAKNGTTKGANNEVTVDQEDIQPTRPTMESTDYEHSMAQKSGSAITPIPYDAVNRYKKALRMGTQEVTRYSEVKRPVPRSVSTPRGFSPEQSEEFKTAKAQYERAARLRNDGEIPMQSSIPAKSKVTRSWQRPKALLLAGDDDEGNFRQRRNVNLSKVARRADFGGGASPIVTSPKTLGR